MEINKEILERIRAFYAQSLNSTEAEEVEQLIASDKTYAEHHKLYRATTSGMKMIEESGQKAWMKALDQEGQSATQLEQLELLKKSASSDKQWRRLAVLGGLVILIAGLVLFFRPQNTVDTTIEAPPINNLDPDQPIAEEPLDDGDELIGSAGTTSKRTINRIDFSLETERAERTEEQRSILIKSITGTNLFYSFKESDLVLELPKQIKLQSLKWIQVKQGDATTEYLQINRVLYELNERLTNRTTLKQNQEAALDQKLERALEAFEISPYSNRKTEE